MIMRMGIALIIEAFVPPGEMSCQDSSTRETRKTLGMDPQKPKLPRNDVFSLLNSQITRWKIVKTSHGVPKRVMEGH